MLGAHPEHMRAWRLFVFLRCLIYKVQPLKCYPLFRFALKPEFYFSASVRIFSISYHSRLVNTFFQSFLFFFQCPPLSQATAYLVYHLVFGMSIGFFKFFQVFLFFVFQSSFFRVSTLLYIIY